MNEHDLVALAQRVHDAERMNFGASSSRDERNANWERIVGIAHHGHPVYNPTPDPRWHCKRASAGRPPSDDVAVLMPSREFWDFIPGSGADYRFEVSASHGALPTDQIVFAPRVPDGGSVAPPAAPLWSQAHATVLGGLLQQQTPNSAGDLAFVQKVAEQFAYSFPAESWGMKRADPTRPVSNNVVARQTSTGLIGFRIVPATTTPAQLDLRGQAFDNSPEVMTPRNHLNIVIQPPPPVDPPVVVPPVPPVPAPANYAPRFDGLDQAIVALTEKVDAQRQEVLDAVRGQSYDIDASAGYLGRVRGTIKPKKVQA